jgi:signal transduction histidine kinase
MNVASIAARKPGSLSEVACIVHDLRNPLATIHGSAEILVRTRLSQPEVHRIARNMYSASVRMRELLEQFLDQSRGTGQDVELSNVRTLVEAAVERIAVSAEFQSVNIVQNIPKGLVVLLNRHSIQRVLVNLLVNALEAMPKGGTIRVTAESSPGSVLIQVRDTGPGIAPEIWDRLFQPFATAGKPNGIGLGLASSRQAVLNHGGEMWAKSSPNGACLSFRLPQPSRNYVVAAV